MPAPRRLLSLLTGAALVPITMLPMGQPVAASAANDDPLSCGTAAVQHTLPNGAQWRMCARIHPVKGLVLEQMEFRPASGSREYAGYLRVLDEVYLAQLNVPYDTGHAQYNDITSYGFGDQYLLPQTADTCLGDASDVEQAFTYAGRLVRRTIPGICLHQVDKGLATHSAEDQLGNGPRIASQGTALEVSSLSKISWYEYQQRITFDDQGGIDVGLGATGDLAPDGAGGPFFSKNAETGWPLGGSRTADGSVVNAASHWHSAIWRVDFGIGGSGDQFVEQWDYEVDSRPGFWPVTRGQGTRKENAFQALGGQSHEDLSWWRVGNQSSLNPDGHARSYEIVNTNTPNTAVPVTTPILTATNDRACAEYASQNLNAGCAGDGLPEYVAADEAPLADPIAWVNVGFHHITRDEDQSPMPIHWQSFSLLPRDFFAQSPSIVDARACINGAPGDTIDSVNLPCIATSVLKPRITPASTPVGPGVLLTTDAGLWNVNRTTWNYSYLWFRDDEPIMVADPDGVLQPVDGTTYRLTTEDIGAEIVSKVTASQVGFVSGTAASKPTVVPGMPPTPSPSPSPSATVGPGPVEVAPAPSAPARRVKATIKASKSISVKARKRAALRVSVVSTGQAPTGRVTIARGGKKATGALVKGSVRIRLPRIKTPGKYRFTIRFGGSPTVAPTTKTVVVRVTKR